MYALIRKILFQLNPEFSHLLAMQSLQWAHRLGLSSLFAQKIYQPCEVMGLNFPNKIGVAAGLDKNADYIDALAALGFGFIEVGTVTPKPQIGNTKPRLFRLPQEEAIINRMGFNNKGATYVLNQLKQIRYRGILGINIGKNKETANENAHIDYLFGFRAFWKYASYIVINISSPNTVGLRELQTEEMLPSLLRVLKKEQQIIFNKEKKYVPMVIKVSPDLSSTTVKNLADILIAEKIDGVIATNTTTQRENISHSIHAKEMGGLSGKPLQHQSTQLIEELSTHLQNKIPIIASGGIMDASSAQEKLIAGADLLQLYTGFIYHGPRLINDIGALSAKK